MQGQIQGFLPGVGGGGGGAESSEPSNANDAN